jgi:hypothetical protein
VEPDTTYPRPEFASDGRRYYRKTMPYETDALISRLDEAGLLSHMGVPMHAWPHVINMYEDPFGNLIDNWIRELPHIYRPQLTYQMEAPEMCGRGLVLYGPSGTYKTTTAAAVLLRVVRMGVPNTDPTGRNFTWHGWAMGRFFDWQEVSELFRDSVKGDADTQDLELRTRVSMIPSGPMTEQANFLVLDDISRETRTTDFNVSQLHRILRQRQSHGFPTILTTNHAPEEWKDTYGDVLAAFLRRAFIPVEFE